MEKSGLIHPDSSNMSARDLKSAGYRRMENITFGHWDEPFYAAGIQPMAFKRRGILPMRIWFAALYVKLSDPKLVKSYFPHPVSYIQL